MKAVLVLCVVVAGALAQLPNSERIFLKQVHDSCQADRATYADESRLKQLNKYIDDAVVGNHMLCMSKKAGLQKGNGDLDIGVIKQKIALVTADKSKVDGLVKKCAVVNGNPQKTANLLWLCFVQNNIDYLHRL
nr:odorant binding protein 28 [Monochamus saltuarius]